MEASIPIPAELHRSRPRPVRLSRSGRVLTVVMCALFFAAPITGLAMYRASLRQQATVQQIEETGLIADGVVTGLKRESKDSNRATVMYRFTIGSKTIDDRAKVRMSLWKTLQVGDRVPIRYLPEDLVANYPDGNPDRALPTWVASLMAAMLAALGLGCAFSLSRQRQLLADGRVAQAVVTEHKVHRSQQGTHRSIRYQFPLLNGAMSTGSSSTGRHPPAIGSGILVLYDAESPKRNRPYPFSLVRIDDEF